MALPQAPTPLTACLDTAFLVDALRGDSSDHRSESERRQDRRQGENPADELFLPDSRVLAPQGIRGPAG